jgi:hypothetical protein
MSIAITEFCFAVSLLYLKLLIYSQNESTTILHKHAWLLSHSWLLSVVVNALIYKIASVFFSVKIYVKNVTFCITDILNAHFCVTLWNFINIKQIQMISSAIFIFFAVDLGTIILNSIVSTGYSTDG